MSKMANYHEACILLQRARSKSFKGYEDALSSLGLSPTSGRYMLRIANRFGDRLNDPKLSRYGVGALRILACSCDSVEKAALESDVAIATVKLEQMQFEAKANGEPNSTKGLSTHNRAATQLSDDKLAKLRGLVE